MNQDSSQIIIEYLTRNSRILSCFLSTNNFKNIIEMRIWVYPLSPLIYIQGHGARGAWIMQKAGKPP